MAHPEPIRPSSTPDSRAESPPDWLMSSAEGAQRRGGEASSSAPGDGAKTEDARGAAAAKGGPVAWKAAASSVPRLREAPVAASAEEAFTGFAQDELEARTVRARSDAPRLAVTAADDSFPAAAPARAPSWMVALGRVRELPLAARIAIPVVPVVALTAFAILGRSERPSLSLGQIRQHPEAFAGRTVEVRGKAGEVFSIGDSYVFELRHSRDTIVVYSRRRRPAVNENVAVKGVVSIGYLDGAPRVALLEDPAP